MDKISLALIFGGISDEHDISCVSAASIYMNLDAEKYDIWPIAITRSGQWYLQDAYDRVEVCQTGRLSIDTSSDRLVNVVPGQGFACLQKTFQPSLIFPIVHGIGGEDGSLQGLIQSAQVPYCGAGVLGSAIGMDKVLAKRLWEAAGLPVVPYQVLHLTHYRSNPTVARQVFDKISSEIGLPLFIKPANSGSSVGVSKVFEWKGFIPAIEKAFETDSKVLIEKAIHAREIEVAVLGTDFPQAYGPGEVIPGHEFYDYTAKYLDPEGARLEVPARLHHETTKMILRMALKAYQTIEGKSFARVDFFIDKTTGCIFINEINTLPGFTAISMFPRMCIAGGLSYPHMLDLIIEDAFTSFRVRDTVWPLGLR